VGLFNLFKNFGNKNNMIKEYLDRKAIVLDVRTPQEFIEGHVEDSINIPLQVLQARFNEIQKMNKPIIEIIVLKFIVLLLS